VSQALRKILVSTVITVGWICCFLFIKPTLVIDFGAGIIFNFKFFMVLLVLLILVLFNIFTPSSAEATKLSFTVALTIAWLSLMIFYHFAPQQGTEAAYAAGTEYDGTVGFFAIVSGLLVCLLWIRFFSDEISLDNKK
jgi:ABC-type transport system involved in cytochrome c biogenesis permease subunit